jgi:hypothetical protein
MSRVEMQKLSMQELSRSRIDEYWTSLSPIAGNILTSMSDQDDWTYSDNPEIQRKLTEVMNSIVEAKDSIEDIENVMPALITILNYLDTSTSLWLQTWLSHQLSQYDINPIEGMVKAAMNIIRESQKPLSTSHQTLFATQEDAKLFLQRSYIFSKMHLFSQIFSHERLEKITRLVDEAQKAGIIKGGFE